MTFEEWRRKNGKKTFSQWKHDREVDNVNEDYIKALNSDLSRFITTHESDYKGLGWENASDVYAKRKSDFDSILGRYEVASEWFKRNKNSLTEEQYSNFFDLYNDAINEGYKSLSYFNDALKDFSKFESQDSASFPVNVNLPKLEA
jgi:hypothetical protein